MKNKKLAVIGLGYVGLPLAVEFGKKFEVIGFDVNKNRVDQIKKNEDTNLEISKKDFSESVHLNFSNIIDDIKYLSSKTRKDIIDSFFEILRNFKK